MSCSVGHRPCSDPALLWLWHRPAATALIRPLAWEPPYAPGAALEKAKRQKTKNKSTLNPKPGALRDVLTIPGSGSGAKTRDAIQMRFMVLTCGILELMTV